MFARAARTLGRKLVPFSSTSTSIKQCPDFSRQFHLKWVSTRKLSPIGMDNIRYMGSESQSTNAMKEDTGLSETCDNDVRSDNPNFEIDTGEFTLQVDEELMQQLTGGDREVIQKVQHLLLEIEVYRQEGMMVPYHINQNHWKDLLMIDSRPRRKRYYEFLFKINMKQENDRKKREERKQKRLEEFGPFKAWRDMHEDESRVGYGLCRNTLFLRLYDTTIARWEHGKLAHAKMFSRPLILDCSYDEYMTPREAKNCAKQIEYLLTNNRRHVQPFNVQLFHAARDSKLMDYLHRIIPTMYDDGYVLDIFEEDFLDVYPRKSLVYLTPHAKDDMKSFSEDDVYIIGAMVDKCDPRPLSLGKAKKNGIRMEKLPLDHYLHWGHGGKSLTLNQMVDILLDIRLTGNWNDALKHVPTRKLHRPDAPEERRERPSNVFEDAELLYRNKGFQRNGFRSNKTFYSESNQGDNRRSTPPPPVRSTNIRSLLHDE